MSQKSIPISTLTVDLIATAPIPLDGTALTVDGITVANNMYIYAAANISSAQRAVWFTGANHTTAWTVASQPISSFQNASIAIYASQGSTYGGLIVNINDTSTGAISPPNPSAVTLTGTQTLTNKTLTAPVITSPTISSGTLSSITAHNPTLDGIIDMTSAGQIGANNIVSTGYLSLYFNTILKISGSSPSVATDRVGTATLVAGTVTVSNTVFTSGTQIYLSIHTPIGSVGAPYISARTDGVSFTISSTNGADTSVVDWFFVQKA